MLRVLNRYLLRKAIFYALDIMPADTNSKQKPSVMLAMPNNMAEDNNSLHSISGISMMLISLLLLWSTAFDVQFVLGTFERTLCHVERKKKMRSAASSVRC